LILANLAADQFRARELRGKQAMAVRIRPVHVALALVSASLGALLAATAVLVALRRTPVVFDCGSSANPELIIQSGAEYLLANPSVTTASNSSLVSLELRDPAALPARWRPQGLQVLRADAQGFQLRPDRSSGSQTVEFEVASGQWRLRDRPGAAPVITSCRRQVLLPAAVNRFNAVPLDYLQLRPWPLRLLNPDLSEAGFRLSLARRISARSGSDYSFYKLVASLPRTALTPSDEERLQAARRSLQAELALTTSFWEYGGSSSATWEYANEQLEAERHAADWCRQQSEGSLTTRLSQGYQLVSSVPQGRDSGQQKALYPDGRFAGYVNYSASCQGVLHTLRRDADLSRLP